MAETFKQTTETAKQIHLAHFEREAASSVEFENVANHIVQEIAIVRDRNH